MWPRQQNKTRTILMKDSVGSLNQYFAGCAQAARKPLRLKSRTHRQGVSRARFVFIKYGIAELRI